MNSYSSDFKIHDHALKNICQILCPQLVIWLRKLNYQSNYYYVCASLYAVALLWSFKSEAFAQDMVCLQSLLNGQLRMLIQACFLHHLQIFRQKSYNNLVYLKSHVELCFRGCCHSCLNFVFLLLLMWFQCFSCVSFRVYFLDRKLLYLLIIRGSKVFQQLYILFNIRLNYIFYRY